MVRGVNLLGRAQVDGHPLQSDKRAALLAHLAYAGEWIGRGQLAALFWPDTGESEARRNLRQLLLRTQALPFADGLEVESERVRWAAESDVQAFREAVASGEWSRARSIYRGPLLDGLSLRDAADFDEWLERERESLHRTYRHAVMREARQHAAAARHGEAVELLERLYLDDDLAEDVLQEYLRNLNLLGRRDAALEAYERFCKRLQDELGLKPLEATSALAQAIRGSSALLPVRERPTSGEPAEEPGLVGRASELAAVRSSPTPFVLVRGEPGMGKTRLLREALPGAAWRVCREGLQGAPYHPLIAVLRQEEESVDDELAVLLPGSSTAGSADPQIAKSRLLQALTRFERRASERAVVYDDLQWADSATLELLLLLANNGIRVYGACRLGEESGELREALAVLRRQGLSTEIDLRPLPVEALMRLLEGAESARELALTAAGNPMFALELRRAGWGREAEGRLPEAITEVIEGRMKPLSAHARRLVQAAAVVGSGFDAGLLARICELPHWDALEALEEAQAVGVTDGESFHHDLLRQTVYGSLSPQRRRLLHQSAAVELAGRAGAQEIAEHWRLAGELEKAVDCWLAATGSLRRRGLHHSALPMLRRAAQLVPAGPLRLRLEVELARLLVEASLLEDAEELNRRLLALDLPAESRLSVLISDALRLIYSGGQLEAAAELLEQAHVVARQVTDRAERFRLWRVRTAALYFRGQYGAGLTAAQEALAEWQGGPDGEEAFFAHYQLALFLDALGRHDEALPHHLESLALARRLEAEHLEVESATSLLVCYRRLGDAQRGVAIAEEALAKAGYLASDWLRNNLADAYLDLGRVDTARSHSEAIIERGDPNFSAICWARLGEIRCREGASPQREFDLALRHLHDCQVPAVQVLALIPLLARAAGQQLQCALEAAAAVEVNATPVHVRTRFELVREEARSRADGSTDAGLPGA